MGVAEPAPQHDMELASASDSQPAPLSDGLSLLQPIASLLALPRVAAELLRRVQRELQLELPMLFQRWRIIAFGLVMQYVHGIFTQLAHRMHQPQEVPLHDVGFELTPELGPDWHWLSESIFASLFALFLLWTFSPFVLHRKKFYTAVLWGRLLMVLVACQALRIVTFSATQLPGPSFHCRAGAETSRRAWPDHWTGHLIIDPSRQMTKSCGDLIFSSHTIFVLTGVLAYTEYGSWLWMKVTAWFCAAVMSYLIVCSRKHYTVDVVIAWYTVPMVFYTLGRRWTTKRPVTDILDGWLAGRTSDTEESMPDWMEELEQVPVPAPAAKGGRVQLSQVHAAPPIALPVHCILPVHSSPPSSSSSSQQALRATHQRKSSSPPAEFAIASAANEVPSYPGGHHQHQLDGVTAGGGFLVAYRALAALNVRGRVTPGLAAAAADDEDSGGMWGQEEPGRGGQRGYGRAD